MRSQRSCPLTPSLQCLSRPTGLTLTLKSYTTTTTTSSRLSIAQATPSRGRSRSSTPERAPIAIGEGVAALEQTEAYFKRRREQLLHLRDAFVEIGASPSHEIFEALDRLDNLYIWIVATMQDVRWDVLIFEGLKAKAASPDERSFTSSAEWLASLPGR